MLFLQESPEEWAAKYNLEITSTECMSCKKMFVRNIPFASKGYRGLMTKEHSCGKMFISSIATPVKSSLENLRRVLFG